MLDVLFINPNSSKKTYQDLSNKYTAIETPTWSLLLAQSCRKQGFSVKILDCEAESLTELETAERVIKENPKFCCFVVYGQNPNSGTTNMSGAVSSSRKIKELNNEIKIGLVGSYVQSLPFKVLKEEKSFDIIFTNEAVYSLWNLLKLQDLNDKNKLKEINGIGFELNNEPFLTKPEKVVPQNRMDMDLPGYAWDLLPFKEKPLDLYRSHFWHAEYDHNKRTPFAALYTSLGCQFKCSFCMINIINRNDNNEIGVASDYSGMRFWSPDFIIKEFDKLNELGVKTIRICDEMFLLNKKYYIPLCKLLSEREYSKDLRMWAYSRVDTIKNKENLELVRKAGIRWLCLGIESAEKTVRLEATKGHFEDIDIANLIKMVHDSDIEVIANYMFGLPKENYESMKKTLDLSIELCTSAWNAYTAMALPGSKLFKDALNNNEILPKKYEDFSFLSYETSPLPTEFLKPEEILKFRDEAWYKYHLNDNFLQRIKNKFGEIAFNNIIEMSKIKLKRKILGD